MQIHANFYMTTEIPDEIEPPPLPPTTCPFLDRAPIEIRQTIYAYLLSARYVDQGPNKLSMASYQFFTRVLRVNKQLYSEAREVLYRENSFVKVRCNWPGIFLTMECFGVSDICRDRDILSRFHEHILELEIDFPRERYGVRHQTEANWRLDVEFLLLDTEIPNFVRCLQAKDLTINTYEDHRYLRKCVAFKMRFILIHPSKGQPNLHAQRAVLEPFRALKIQKGCVTFHGAMDTIFVRDLMQIIMPHVQWARAKAWQLYNVARAVNLVGDRALRGGYIHNAYIKYKIALDLHHFATHHSRRMSGVTDEGLRSSWHQLQGICRTNLLLCILKNFDFLGDGGESVLEQTDGLDHPQTTVFGLQKSRLYHYRAIGYAEMDNDNAALAELHKALALDPKNDYIRLDIRITLRRLNAVTEEEKSTAGKLTATRLANDPMMCSPPVYLPAPGIANERYLLRRLNYRGDMLMHLPDGELVDQEAVGKSMRYFHEFRQYAGGLLVMRNIWIGGGPLPGNVSDLPVLGRLAHLQ